MPLSSSLFAWSFGIGDPTVGGWLTVLAYFSSAYLCLQAFMAQKSGPRRPYWASIRALFRVIRKHFPHTPLPAQRAAFWLFLSAMMLVMGVNKQLDLQTLLTDIGRYAARGQGWYEQRRVVQVLVIGAVCIAAVLALVLFIYLTRKHRVEYRLALIGLTMVTAFVVVRAMSFHEMDDFIGVRFLGIRANFLLEFPGIVLIGICARRSSRRVPREP